MKKVSIVLMVAALGAFGQPAFAQVATTPEQVASACAAGGDCPAIVSGFIARARAAGVLNNALVAQLAVALGSQITATTPAGTRSSISAALNEVAAASTDPNQQAAIQEVASTVQQGGEVDTAGIDTGGGASGI